MARFGIVGRLVAHPGRRGDRPQEPTQSRQAVPDHVEGAGYSGGPGTPNAEER